MTGNTLFEQAVVHIDRQEMDLAASCLVGHLNTAFHDDRALMMLGAVLQQKGQHGLSAALTHRAIDIRRATTGKPYPEALGNLAAAFKAENKLGPAEELWNLALEVEEIPHERAKILSNLSGCHINEGRPERAIAYLDEALSIRPDLLSAQYNRGLAHLEAGNWRQGWIDYHAGFASGDRRTRRYRDIPEWDGSPGQRVIVWGEQGVGDEILFSSCLPDLIAVSKRVIFDCHPRLVETFRRSFPGIEVHGTRKIQGELDWLDEVEADATVCLSSLPMYFRNRDEEFPGKPFLKAGEGPWKEGHLPLPLRPPRIGIAWAGGTKKTRQDLRSVPLDAWLPVLRSLVGADFYSLQYTASAAREVCELEEASGIRVKHYPGWVECRDYDRTISFAASMDLVITCCTAIHHAANAVGTKTWTLVPSKPAWRYGVKGELWYRQTNTFFRQEPGESWETVMERAANALKEEFSA
jgi:tetratricopeptide (TPR) repeat protein